MILSTMTRAFQIPNSSNCFLLVPEIFSRTTVTFFSHTLFIFLMSNTQKEQTGWQLPRTLYHKINSLPFFKKTLNRKSTTNRNTDYFVFKGTSIRTKSSAAYVRPLKPTVSSLKVSISLTFPKVIINLICTV